jgi:hypothetical protein
LLPLVYGQPTGWINNIYRPVRKIAHDLDETLGPNATVISLVDGAFSSFYYPNEKRYPPILLSDFEVLQSINGQCLSLKKDIIKQYQVRAVVSFVGQDICSDVVERVVEYPGSNMQLTIIAR